MDCLVLSEKVELCRCLRGLEISAKADALPNGLWRIGDRFCCLPVLVAIGFGLVPGGLIVLSCGAICVQGLQECETSLLTARLLPKFGRKSAQAPSDRLVQFSS